MGVLDLSETGVLDLSATSTAPSTKTGGCPRFLHDESEHAVVRCADVISPDPGLFQLGAALGPIAKIVVEPFGLRTCSHRLQATATRLVSGSTGGLLFN